MILINRMIYHAFGLEELIPIHIHKTRFRFNASPMKISMTFFTELEQIIIKPYGTTEDTKLPK